MCAYVCCLSVLPMCAARCVPMCAYVCLCVPVCAYVCLCVPMCAYACFCVFVCASVCTLVRAWQEYCRSHSASMTGRGQSCPQHMLTPTCDPCAEFDVVSLPQPRVVRVSDGAQSSINDAITVDFLLQLAQRDLLAVQRQQQASAIPPARRRSGVGRPTHHRTCDCCLPRGDGPQGNVGGGGTKSRPTRRVGSASAVQGVWGVGCGSRHRSSQD